MDIRNYQKLAMRTSPEGHDQILNGCMGLIGESGEIVDIVKKWKFQSGDHAELPKEKLIDECGDVLWYCAEFATGIGADLAEIVTEKSRFFDFMREMIKKCPIEFTVMRLAAMAVRPMTFLYNGLAMDTQDIRDDWNKAMAKVEIVGIVSMVRDILEIYCGIKLEDAMESNIEKLRKRYPDGFNPERSIHRSE